MEVKIKYEGYRVSNLFGLNAEKETIRLPDNSKYKDLLSILRKKYKKTVKSRYTIKKEESIDHMFNTIFITSEDKHLINMKDEAIDPDNEVMVMGDLAMGG